MISDGGRFMVERCWGAEKTLDGARMKAEMIEYIKAYETEVATLESANAGLTAELSALRAEKAELDSGMHEMGAKITALVKAGDAMADKLNSFGTDAYDAEWGSAVSLPAGKVGE